MFDGMAVVVGAIAVAALLVLSLPRKDRTQSLYLPRNPSDGQNPFDVDHGSGEEQS